VKKILKKLLLRVRLMRIEHAVHVRLGPFLRDIVMCPDRPYLYGMERRSGKTLTACMWILLHRRVSMKGCCPAVEVPDPDIDISRGVEDFTYRTLCEMAAKCRKHNIKVCDTPYPMRYPYWKGCRYRGYADERR